MYCQQLSIYDQEPVLGIQEQCLSLREKNNYQTIRNVAAYLMFKKGQLVKPSHIGKGKQCEWGIF